MISLSKIKTIYHKTPQPIKNCLLRVPFGLFLGSAYREHLRHLKAFDSLTFDEKIVSSEAKLLNYVNDAIADTPFYIDFAKQKGWSKIESMDQFFELPLLTKEQLTEDLKWFTPNNVKKSYTVTTGGTSGKQTELIMSNDAYKKEWAYKTLMLEKLGVNINAKRVCLRGVDFYGSNSSVRYNPLYKEIQVSPFKLNESEFENILSKVRSFDPKWIHGYPSSIYEFARLCKLQGIDNLKLNAALLVSEKLYSEQAELIESVLGTQLLSFYGMTERVIFAPQEENGSFVPDLAYGYTEEREGQLIGTGYVNNATRLIRYCTGDEVAVDKQAELVTKIISLKGRWGKEYLVGKNGTKITMTSLNVHSPELHFIKCYQFFQNENGKCQLKIVLSDRYTPSIAELDGVKSLFQRKVRDELYIALKIVDEIPLTKRGKHKFIESTLY
jgi:phenylacetate-CoA ligase